MPIFIIFILIAFICNAFSREGIDWDAVPNSPEVKEWYKTLMQPDNYNVSCCGEADAYWADSFKVSGDKYVAIITDTRDDKMLGRPHIEPGTEIVVPNHKLKYDKGNPTGHGVIFVSIVLDVYCYVVPGGG